MQVPWANLGKSAVVVLIDRLYILAGPKAEAKAGKEESYEVTDVSTCMHYPRCTLAATCTAPQTELQLIEGRSWKLKVWKQAIMVMTRCAWSWQAEELEKEAKRRRVDRAELRALQVHVLLVHASYISTCNRSCLLTFPHTMNE